MVRLFGWDQKIKDNFAVASHSGSNAAAELNWIALESAPSGAQLGTTSLDSWTTGTKCKKVDFPLVSLIFKR